MESSKRMCYIKYNYNNLINYLREEEIAEYELCAGSANGLCVYHGG